MIIDRRSANAVGGKTARACDSCIRRRARWYCTADDAFLCQGCDTSVHSANQLASRHERVRLGLPSLKDSSSTGGGEDSTTPAWHQGFTKKARTRRNTNKSSSSSQLMISSSVLQEAKNEDKFFNPPLPLVPEINGSEELLTTISSSSPFDHENNHEIDEQVSYQVPVFDPFAAAGGGGEGILDYEHGEIDDLERFLLPSDMELAEFAADVESLLGGEIKNDVDRYEFEESGGAHFCHDHHQGGRLVKVEDEDEEEDEGGIEAVLACQFDPMIDVMRETLDWNFDYESPMTGGEEVEEEKVVVESMIMNQESKAEMRMRRNNNMSLKLNYEEVITSWANQKSPWTDGIRPEFNLDDDCWPDFMGMCPTNSHHHNGEIIGGVVGGQVGSGDGAREARVSRYREKRRTRLFSKKIRYEVRKLNAEKRPRMRGRFVKRTSFGAVPTTFPNYLNK